MNAATCERLLSLNRQFYAEHGRQFSETRGRLQPGVKRILETLTGDESVLDLGCGNGELARVLSKREHRGHYLGLDSSPELLKEAQREPLVFPARFAQVDLVQFSTDDLDLLATGHWSLITAFAVMHHLPGFDLRVHLLQEVHRLLGSHGHFMHSNWQFLSSPRLKARIQPWEAIGLSPQGVDANDYLLDWRHGSTGLRYVHHFNEEELSKLAEAAHFEIEETFYSDGENGKLSIYQVWKKST